MVTTTDLTISGKAAQFGRGVLGDVAGNLIAQFAKALEADILGGAPPAGAQTVAAAPQPTAATGDSVDLLKVIAVPMAKRFAPALAALAAGGVIGFLLGRRRNRRSDDLLDALSRLVS